jgi:ATP-binding protein involved in chromosome partitioning
MGRMPLSPTLPAEADIRTALGTVNDPEIRRPITDLGMVETVTVHPDGVVEVGILLTVAGCPLRDKLTSDITGASTSA